MNKMDQIRIEKLTLNIGVGKDRKLLQKSLDVLKIISGKNPVKTITQKRIATWGLRPGLPIGCKVTIRGKEAEELLKRLLEAVEFKLQNSNFDARGNIAFGIKEYIDIPGVNYDPKIGMLGLQVCVTLEKPGFRIKKRKVFKKKLSKKKIINQEDAINFFKQKFNVKLGEKE